MRTINNSVSSLTAVLVDRLRAANPLVIRNLLTEKYTYDTLHIWWCFGKDADQRQRNWAVTTLSYESVEDRALLPALFCLGGMEGLSWYRVVTRCAAVLEETAANDERFTSRAFNIRQPLQEEISEASQHPPGLCSTQDSEVQSPNPGAP